MREWVSRLRTALAALAATFLLWQTPLMLGPLFRSGDDAGRPPQGAAIVRVWLCEDWTGSAMHWLTGQVVAYEKAHRNTRVIVRRAQPGDWSAKGAVPPDLLLFAKGVIRDPEPFFERVLIDLDLREAVQSCGEWRGRSYAAPVCYGGTVRLVNTDKPEGFELTMQSEAEFIEFTQGRAKVLIASVREVRRLTALSAAGKGVSFLAEPHGAESDRVLMAGIFPQPEARQKIAVDFLNFLLLPEAQDALPKDGLLPVINGAQPIDIDKQPLLAALQGVIVGVANAFD